MEMVVCSDISFFGSQHKITSLLLQQCEIPRHPAPSWVQFEGGTLVQYCIIEASPLQRHSVIRD